MKENYVPVITIASNPYPSYLLTYWSNTIPEKLSINIAPNSGLQPSFSRGLTCEFLKERYRRKAAPARRMRVRKSGREVDRSGSRIVEIMENNKRVIKSPSAEAMGGAT
jgi:hypothetical protein